MFSSNIAAIFLKALVLGLAIVFGASTAHSDSLAIQNVHIISPDGKTSATTRNVLIRDGRISAISQKRLEADRVIDGKGRFLIPGLIDTHVHLDSIPGYQATGNEDPALVEDTLAQIPRSYLYFGFTTVLDLAAEPEFIARWNKQEVAPRALFCIPLPIANGYPLAWMPADQQFAPTNSRYMLYDARQADAIPDTIKPEEHSPQALVKRAKADGATCVKMFYETGFGRLKNLPVPNREMVDEVVAAARQQNLPVVLHGNSEAAYEFALQTKVDFLAHGMWHWDNLATASPEQQNRFFQRIVQSDKKVQPTIQVIHGEQELFNPDFLDHPSIKQVMPQKLIEWYKSEAGQWMKKNMAHEFDETENLTARQMYSKVTDAYKKPLGQVTRFTKALDAGKNTLLFGSDTPSGPFYTQFPGLNGHLELQRWADAGVDLRTLFKALTIDNARILGMENNIGGVNVGKTANLLLLSENPLNNVNAYNSIQVVILEGKVIQRSQLSADNTTAENSAGTKFESTSGNDL